MISNVGHNSSERFCSICLPCMDGFKITEINIFLNHFKGLMNVKWNLLHYNGFQDWNLEKYKRV